MFRKTQKNLIYLFIFAGSFALIFFHPPFLTTLKFQFVQITSYPIRIFSAVTQELNKVIFYHQHYEEYRKYKKEAELLKARVIGLEEVIEENARLGRLLAFKRKLVYSSVAARVIGREPSSWNSSVIIDKGRNDGIAAGQPVLTDLGVIGKVMETGPRQAKVILLTDPQSS